jgi:hypothetical protein
MYWRKTVTIKISSLHQIYEENLLLCIEEISDGICLGDIFIISYSSVFEFACHFFGSEQYNNAATTSK